MRTVIANEAQQTDLIHVAQAAGVGRAGRAVRQSGRPLLVKADTEEEALRQGWLSPGLTQVVDCRQQQLWHFLPTNVGVLQIAAQHIECIAQRSQLTVTLLTGTGGDIGGLLKHFLSQQLGTGKLDEIQGATHLLQIFHSLLQQAAVIPLGDKLFETLFGLFHGGEQLVTHLAQGCRSSDHQSAEPLLAGISRRIPLSACSCAQPWPRAGRRTAASRRSSWPHTPGHHRPGDRACSESCVWYREWRWGIWQQSRGP